MNRQVIQSTGLALTLCLVMLGAGACGAATEPAPPEAEASPMAQPSPMEPAAVPTEPPTGVPPAAPTAAPEATAPEEAVYPPEKPSAVDGKVIFESNCVECHGAAGDGSGLAGAANFTDVAFMHGEKPVEFFEAITGGKEGTAMPAWEGELGEMERWDVLYYVWSLATSPAEIAAGKALFATHCVDCHGGAGDGSGLAGAANFTDQTFMSKEKPEEFHEKITEGVEGTAMPVWGETLSEDEIWSLVNYVWTFAYEYPEG